MPNYFHIFKNWYIQRNSREHFFVLALSFALIYALLHFFLLLPIEKKHAFIRGQISELHKKTEQLNNQIHALGMLPQTDIYKRWLHLKELSLGMSYEYRSILQPFSIADWQKIIETTIRDQDNISLVAIKVLPEEKFNPNQDLQIKRPIYEQRINASIKSGYFETISYLEKLMKVIPHMHWRKLDYKVTDYPQAEINMEFSLFYEKENA